MVQGREMIWEKANGVKEVNGLGETDGAEDGNGLETGNDLKQYLTERICVYTSLPLLSAIWQKGLHKAIYICMRSSIHIAIIDKGYRHSLRGVDVKWRRERTCFLGSRVKLRF
jgi:hypothetical protein